MNNDTMEVQAVARSDTFKMNPMSLFALIGGVIAFIAIGAYVDMLWVALGAALGGIIGWGVRRYAGGVRAFADAVDLTDSATKKDLSEEAARLGIEGRSAMTKEELARAVTERRTS